MKKIRIQNLRSLKDTNEIELKPLTVLVGKNSSGKSTFLRFFPLMKQTLETTTNEPVLWYSKRFVDFGSFEESLNSNSETNIISFSFEFKVPSNTQFLLDDFYRYSNNIRYFNEITNEEMICRVEISSKKDYLEKFSIFLEDYSIEVNQKEKGEKIILKMNGLEVKEDWINGSINNVQTMLPSILLKKADKLIGPDMYYKNKLEKKLQQLAHSSTKTETIENLISKIRFVKFKDIFNNIDKSETTAHTLLEKLQNLDNNEDLVEIKQFITAMYLNNLIMVVNRYLENFFGSVKYIAPLRASAERYYRINGLSVNEVDPQGENIPMMLHNMPDWEKSSFTLWAKKNMGFEVTTKFVGGHTSMQLKYASGEEINLADTGFGYSQILPILIVLWQSTIQNRNKLNFSYQGRFRETFFNLVIEQPELHLHPGLQAKLIDTFIKIITTAKENKINLNIIIETHSETMINRIGYLIDKKFEGFSKDLVDILIFENSKNPYETDIKKAVYNEEGIITNWPIGFFNPEV